jgi:DNA invertase Pin-like site-specific DNA recombinase
MINTTESTATGAKRKGLSYIRFSTLAQGNEGRNSTTRQKDALSAALAKWNLELDATYSDKGKSGYHQRHIAKGGAMHELRNMAREGKLAGKVLVVEDFDRAGRMQVTDAAPLLLDMLNNGVDMVVGAYGGEYFSKESVNASPYLFYRALDEMDRGFRESKRKTELAKAKWKERLDAVANSKPVAVAAELN